MRTLVLLRGLPGIGKSTWINENELEAYTLSADTVRTLFACPVRDPESGVLGIDQRYNKKVFEFIRERMIERMRRGETLFIDAQNIDITEYTQLAYRFSYNVIVVQFPLDKERALKQNKYRSPAYKVVPEEVIERSYERMISTKIPESIAVFEPSQFINTFSKSSLFGLVNLDEDMYKLFPDGCVFFGDLHGCMQPVQDYFKEHPFNDKKLYVFLGDYLDRGPQNGELLEFLIELSSKYNCMFLEGNHFWERYYAKGQMEDIMSDEFIQYTIPQIAHIPKEQILSFCAKWEPYHCFMYGRQFYFCSHAGFGYLPTGVTYVSIKDFVKGNKYSDDVDKWYNSNYKELMPVQVHGHRNQYEYPPTQFEYSVNLCNPVESGAPLVVMEVNKEGERKFISIENTLGDKLRSNLRESFSKQVTKTESEEILVELRKHPEDIKEKVLTDGVSSFNFSRDVFFKQRWTDLSKYARGLFLDSYTGEVIARGWSKFFNWGEYDVTEDYIREHMEYPVYAFKKYNGYLGLLSVHKGELFFASKSTNEGPYAENFKRIFYEKVSKKDADALYMFLCENNCTMLFEVIDPENDPHIIKYNDSDLILLDMVNNSHKEESVSFDTSRRVAIRFKLKCKELLERCENFEALKQLQEYISSKELPCKYEGVVFEGKNKFRVKVKTHYYKMWKHMRSIKERLQADKVVSCNNLEEEEVKIYEFMKSIDKEELKNMSIINVREKYKEKGESK